jgi:hypothetical protein
MKRVITLLSVEESGVMEMIGKIVVNGVSLVMAVYVVMAAVFMTHTLL